ncbi:oxidoreductase-like domain-containing protein [Luteimonas sp. RD2P54]|uniref:Oxidoreductase-like domain-containing protein n=1 Tax=Luteimonas endophytica TaxID=3042023 RepID=A0ABT6J8Z4_9GAMM|nr:oxidoreductase-like domain-containing protein [Luteimonas endophytica]MDH5823087.1 oxidoreductase-like domain-containing protein [Luteimonas endophytica]
MTTPPEHARRRAVDHDPDPRPQPPPKPLPSDCCESGCQTCVYDLYADELALYGEALAAWRTRHPDADAGTDGG